MAVELADEARGGSPLPVDWLAWFRGTYLAIFLFLIVYVLTIQVGEALLRRHFAAVIDRAVQVDARDGSVVQQIQERLDAGVRRSAWVRLGGARVTIHALGADGQTLYLNGPIGHSSEELDPAASLAEAKRVLPASAELLTLSLPLGALLPNAILVGYAAILVQILFVRSRAQARREAERLRDAVESRDATARRTAEIEGELHAIRGQLAAVEPERAEYAEEIRGLERERAQLQTQLEVLARREAELRGSSQEAVRLHEEHQALEELLDEALGDLRSKEEAIRELESRLKKAAKAPPQARGREGDQLGRRLYTLYKNLEIDDRAIDDLVDLRDETMKLKAEEVLKRLSDDPETSLVRRKVGGLPPHLSIFELGFAGKGRIYFTQGRQRRFRVLSIGAKNTQKTDLEYLSRLPRE
jgi:DNA repair exonuclease SbcCD ATPase subunit